GEVGADHFGARQLRGQGFRLLARAAAMDHHVPPAGGEAADDRRADPAGAAGNEDGGPCCHPRVASNANSTATEGSSEPPYWPKPMLNGLRSIVALPSTRLESSPPVRRNSTSCGWLTPRSESVPWATKRPSGSA